MSRSWAGGSTRAWRELRVTVSARDRYRCRVQLPGTCLGHAPLHATRGVRAGHLHHTQGRAITGDDPRFVVWACEPCNLKVGDPTRTPDPAPRPRTRW